MRLNLATRSPLALIFLGFGALVALFGAVALLSSAQFMLRSVSSEGLVVAFQEPQKSSKSKSDSGATKVDPPVAPVIEFAPAGGKPVRITGGWFEKKPTFALGDRVPVRYHPDNPQTAIVDVFGETWAFALAFLALGSVFLLAGFLLPQSKAR